MVVQHRPALLTLLTIAWVACSDGGPHGSGRQGEPNAGAGASAEGGASGSAGGTPAGSSGSPIAGNGGVSPLPDSGVGLADANNDAELGPDASGDSGLLEPIPVEACSEELDAQRGVVQPDFGPLHPALAFVGDPNDDGAFDVLSIDVTIPNPDPAREPLDATFYAPSSDGGTSVADGARPLLLVLHGFGATHRNYEHYTHHLATHGFIVLGMTMPFGLVAAHDKNADEALAAIDFALSDTAPEPVRGKLDAQRIAVLGHSFGGKIAFYAAARDPRIDLVVGWDPSNAGGAPCFVDAEGCNAFPVAPNCLANDSGIVHQLHAETVVFRAAADGANPEPAHNALNFYRGAPAPATLLDFDVNVAHGDFANPDAAVSPHTRRVQLAFLLTRFMGATGLEQYLPSGSMIDMDERVVRVLSR